jgi:FkbH-like protein
LIPNDIPGELTLYFGLIEFVREEVPATRLPGRIKCLVWDLDHTLWDGVLIESDLKQLSLKPGIRQLIEEADRHGILQSIASKNNFEEAMEAIRHFGLEQFFLAPQISWTPKSESIKAIAVRLNIGIDTLVFIDDQDFERSQVEAACTGIRTLDAKDALSLLDTESFAQPITQESRTRRQMYRVEHERQQNQRLYQDDYHAFLKDCNIRLRLARLNEQNAERVHELTQRTNQMNFSGKRYDREVLRTIMHRAQMETFVISCEDRFGSYGIVGFGVFDTQNSRLTDLMFSCRIQSKRVEHAFLQTIISRHVAASGTDFYASYRKTPRNAPSGQVFNDLGMSELETIDGTTLLVCRKDNVPPNDNIVSVTFSDVSEVVNQA